MKMFPEWDMIKAIAVDPAHEFYNLVKDFLALIGDCSKMKLKRKYLDNEQHHGRFLDVKVGDAPWHVSTQYKTILTELLATLKIPNSWPNLMSYFTDEYEKIKIAECLAFCGDIGSYLTNLTDIEDNLKAVFVELLKVSGGFISKTSKSADLAKLHTQMVSHFTIIIIL